MNLETISMDCNDWPQPKTRIEINKTDDGYELHAFSQNVPVLIIPFDKEQAEHLAFAILKDLYPSGLRSKIQNQTSNTEES